MTVQLDKNLMISYISKMPEASISEVAKALKKDNKLSESVPTIKKKLQEVQDSLYTSEPELFILEYDNYTADSSNYYFKKGNNSTVISIESVGKILCAYVTEGLNLTKTQVSKLLDIPTETIQLILTKLKITKDSRIVLEAILDQYDDKFHANFIKVCMNKVAEQSTKYDDPTKEAVFDTYKKSLFGYRNKQRDLEVLMKEVGERALDVVQFSPAPSAMSKEITVCLADIHFGAKSETYSKEIVIKQLGNVANKLRHYTDCKVNVILLGDIFHTITGLKHPDMWKSVEPGIYGANALIEATEVLTGFLSSIINLNSVHVVGGNHDIMANSVKEEPSAEGAKLLSYMLSKALEPAGIKVVHDHHLITLKQGKMTIIGIHGDQATGKMSATEMAWKFGDNTGYNIILTGHLHSRIMARKDDNTNCRKMNVPAFCPPDEYATRNGWSNLSGFIIIAGEELPEIIDVPLKY